MKTPMWHISFDTEPDYSEYPHIDEVRGICYFEDHELTGQAWSFRALRINGTWSLGQFLFSEAPAKPGKKITLRFPAKFRGLTATLQNTVLMRPKLLSVFRKKLGEGESLHLVHRPKTDDSKWIFLRDNPAYDGSSWQSLIKLTDDEFDWLVRSGWEPIERY